MVTVYHKVTNSQGCCMQNSAFIAVFMMSFFMHDSLCIR